MEEITAEFEELLAFSKALGDEKRLRIVRLLAQQPLCVEELARSSISVPEPGQGVTHRVVAIPRSAGHLSPPCGE